MVANGYARRVDPHGPAIPRRLRERGYQGQAIGEMHFDERCACGNWGGGAVFVLPNERQALDVRTTVYLDERSYGLQRLGLGAKTSDTVRTNHTPIRRSPSHEARSPGQGRAGLRSRLAVQTPLH